MKNKKEIDVPIKDLEEGSFELDVLCHMHLRLLHEDGVYKHIYIHSTDEEHNVMHYSLVNEDGTLGPPKKMFPIPDYVYAVPGNFECSFRVRKFKYEDDGNY